jgi:hypothetical protein
MGMGVGWRGRLCLAAMAIVVSPVILALSLTVADWTEIRHRTRDPLTAVALTIDRGDRLHYVGHLMLGRALDLCACADALAADQYYRAAWHARTVRQLQLVTVARPRGPMAWVTDGAGIVTSGVHWGERGSLWLTGHLTHLI